MRLVAFMRLHEVPIEAPCEEDWDQMRPEAGGCRRWCELCEQRVHDLSAMGEAKARAFLTATEGRDVCIAYEHDSQGNIVFAPVRPPALVPLARLRRGPAVEVAKLASAASLAAVLAACTPHDPDPSVRVVSDPIDGHTQPMVVIPPRDALEPPTAHPDPGTPAVEEPCEPLPPPPRTLAKKGKRKRMGRRASTPDFDL
jgi:hypothetical protein